MLNLLNNTMFNPCQFLQDSTFKITTYVKGCLAWMR
jgi:hypothetical protein